MQTIKNKDGQDVELETIAEEIVKLADGFNTIQSSKLTRRAILVLLRDETGMALKDIDRVLTAAQNLKHFLKK